MELNFDELAKAMYGSSTPVEVEMQTLKVMLSALSLILINKGIMSKVELQEYINKSYQMYKTLSQHGCGS